MPYLPQWEKLADALKRVESFGTPAEVAKVEICQAIADRNIPVRVVVAKADHAIGGRTLQGSNLNVPRQLSPSDFNWDLSRPLAPWATGPTGPYHTYDLSSWSWKERAIDLIELETASTIHWLCKHREVSEPGAGGVADKVSVQLGSPDELADMESKKGMVPTPGTGTPTERSYQNCATAHQEDLHSLPHPPKRTRGRRARADEDAKRDIEIVITEGIKAKSLKPDASCREIAECLLQNTEVKKTPYQSPDTIEKILRGVLPAMRKLAVLKPPFKKDA